MQDQLKLDLKTPVFNWAHMRMTQKPWIINYSKAEFSYRGLELYKAYMQDHLDLPSDADI